MSKMNRALADLARPAPHTANVKPAKVDELPSAHPWIWLLAGVAISLGIGSWAMSGNHSAVIPVQPNGHSAALVSAPSELLVSPTSKLAPGNSDALVLASLSQPPDSANVSAPQKRPVSDTLQDTVSVSDKSVKGSAVQAVATENSAKTSDAPAPQSQPARDNTRTSDMVIEQVSLTPEQLAEQALGMADKALDADDLNGALSGYNQVLRYDPRNESARQKLAALYYGKGDTRKAFDVLQEGIRLHPSGEILRLTLSKLLIKAKQQQAALSPLVYLPSQPSRDYLAMRAALAQKNKRSELALESYQQLTKLDTDNARWWLGLGIEQERMANLPQAVLAYQQALGKVGISVQSQDFIRGRLKAIERVYEEKK